MKPLHGESLTDLSNVNELPMTIRKQNWKVKERMCNELQELIGRNGGMLWQQAEEETSEAKRILICGTMAGVCLDLFKIKCAKGVVR